MRPFQRILIKQNLLPVITVHEVDYRSVIISSKKFVRRQRGIMEKRRI